jgi:hypothetical protein
LGLLKGGIMDLGKIAFLETLMLDDDSGIMGAILVTDSETKPLEFRVTAPVKTTDFQKTLYGDVLLEHILVELISLPLVSAISEEIDLILVKDPLFLGINNKQGVRVVRVYNAEEQNDTKGIKNLDVNFIGTNGCTLYLETSKKYESELLEIKELVKSLAESRNLLEPFDRLKAACEQVHLQKTND